jgi:fructose 1,6-bisphosphate aldolase/phosphatase
MGSSVTLSVIKADVGGYVGHSAMHPELVNEAKDYLETAKARHFLIDYRVTSCGDDLELIMTHQGGPDNVDIHRLAWEVFEACTDIAERLKLYGAGQDL